MRRNSQVAIRLFAVDMLALNALAKLAKTTPSSIARYLLRAGLEATKQNKAGDIRYQMLDSEAVATAKQIALEREHPDYEPDIEAQNATLESVVEA